MSRLDSFIQRLQAQRACLDWAVEAISDVPGAIIEIGLGNGRTYDHLRAKQTGREIFVFERQVAAHPDCIPDPDHLILGDLAETLPGAAHRLPAAALIHVDIGTGDEVATRATADWLGPRLAPLIAPGGLVLSDQRLDLPGCPSCPPPVAVPAGRYFIYQAG